MTIGKFGHDYSTGPNPDFTCLMKCHQDLCEQFNIKVEDVHVSMGMSDDFEEAVGQANFQKNILTNHCLDFRLPWEAQSFESDHQSSDIGRKKARERLQLFPAVNEMGEEIPLCLPSGSSVPD